MSVRSLFSFPGLVATTTPPSAPAPVAPPVAPPGAPSGEVPPSVPPPAAEPTSPAVSLDGFDIGGLLESAWLIGLSLIEAFLILAIGWTFAKIVQRIVAGSLRRTGLDRRLSYMLSGGRDKTSKVAQTAGSLTYGFLMLFVAIEVLRALGLTMITEPLTGLVDGVMGFVPRLFAAAALGLVAWGAANLARMASLRFLHSIELDRRLGVDSEIDLGGSVGRLSLSRTLGDAIYYFVFLFFLPQVLDALQMDGLAPVQAMVGEILGVMPELLGAAMVLALLYFVARIVQRLTEHLLAGFGFDRLPRLLGFEAHAGPRASVAAGWVVLVALLFVGATQAAEMLGLALVAEVAEGLLVGFFRILIACVIFALGLWASGRVSTTLQQWQASRGQGSSPLALVAKWGILAFSGAMALGQTGLAPEILHLTVGAAALGLAIAAGLAFGLGGRAQAARWIERRSGEIPDVGSRAHPEGL